MLFNLFFFSSTREQRPPALLHREDGHRGVVAAEPHLFQSTRLTALHVVWTAAGEAPIGHRGDGGFRSGVTPSPPLSFTLSWNCTACVCVWSSSASASACPSSSTLPTCLFCLPLYSLLPFLNSIVTGGFFEENKPWISLGKGIKPTNED